MKKGTHTFFASTYSLKKVCVPFFSPGVAA